MAQTPDVENDIKPQITIGEATKLAKKLYGLQILRASELNSYDDRCYHLTTSNSPNGFVLKIVNSHDSKSTDFFEAQNELLFILRKNNIPVPNIIKNLSGSYQSLEILQWKDTTREYLVRLFDYLPGELFKNVPGSLDLYYQVGVRIGQLDVALKDFRHVGLENHKSKWHMNFIPELHPFLKHVKDNARRAVAGDVIDQFYKTVVPAMDYLPKCVIHGDMNEQNLLVAEAPEGSWKICAILDFGDANVGCRLFDIAAGMCYMMLESLRFGIEPIDAGAATLAGYMSLSCLSTLELSLLKVAICGRLCQSLVLGLSSHAMQPDNSYILSTQENGWKILLLLWNIPDEELTNTWLHCNDRTALENKNITSIL